MLGWERFRPAALKQVPGALIGVMAGTLAAFTLGLDVTRVDVPQSIASAIALPGLRPARQMDGPVGDRRGARHRLHRQRRDAAVGRRGGQDA